MSEFSFLNAAAVIVTLAALFGYINHRWLGLPHAIGIVVIALLASLGAIALDAIFPALALQQSVRAILADIDFHDVLMKGMLSFLLFAGALHVNLDDLLSRKWAIGTMATAGVLMSTFMVGFAVYGVSSALGIAIPLTYCLVFGALIAPTDPVAVLGILKTVKLPQSLEAKIAGESLFNDGVGVVVFIIMVAIAGGGGGHGGESVGALDVIRLFAQEALGGAALGLAAGYIAYRAMKSIDEHNLEVLITLALVMLTYGVAAALHLSGPIAVVIAGLLIGNRGTRLAMSEKTRDHVQKFWSLLDEIMNSALFLLIGFEVFALSISGNVVALMIIAIPIALAARFISVATPLTLLSLRRDFTKGAIPVLTWGGLRGGISVALVLSLPQSAIKDTLLAVTYGVVIFSIVVQGLTVKFVVKHMVK
ncbi:MAG: sodium:proton antiporter [Alphaproteobacteria bacterium]|jgi:CPA1 family monovalent cation:H+ antiporter|nr:sodium:proton antiporter [Alphaproteobacteria bacterium]MDP6590492.1 sodium:proton antiporter [Alphaproteobacteria bacterium]MDP6816939.1 sodium:proton antiporter [Alphaproteobacteria bacterium]